MSLANELRGQKFLLDRVRFLQSVAKDNRRRPSVRSEAKEYAEALLSELGKRKR